MRRVRVVVNIIQLLYYFTPWDFRYSKPTPLRKWDIFPAKWDIFPVEVGRFPRDMGHIPREVGHIPRHQRNRTTMRKALKWDKNLTRVPLSIKSRHYL